MVVFHGSLCLSLTKFPPLTWGLPFSPGLSLLCPSQVGPLWGLSFPSLFLWFWVGGHTSVPSPCSPAGLTVSYMQIIAFNLLPSFSEPENNNTTACVLNLV